MKWFKSRCYNGGNRHKLEAHTVERERAGTLEVLNKVDTRTWMANSVREFLTIREFSIYCLWCGKEIRREDA